MKKIEDARSFATAAHAGQLRKYTGEPYIVHPEAVATTLAAIPGIPSDVIAAAWLHDVVEDTPVTIEGIRQRFGYHIARYVAEVTDVAKPEDGNRAVRTEINRKHLAKAGPFGQTIKLADMIDNTSSITRYDEAFARVYMREKAMLLPFLTWGHPALRARAAQLLEDYETSQVQHALGRKAGAPC